MVMEAKKLSPGMLEILKHIHTHPNTQTPHNEVRGRLWKAWKQLPNDLYDASAENGYSLTPTGLEHLKKSGKLNEDMGINTPSDDMVCDHDEPTPGEKLKSKLRKKKR